jgi:hypothetical protein
MRYHQFEILVLNLLVSFIILTACDHGIAPLPINPEPAGFTGRITFIGSWPDSVKRTHIVVFKDPLLEAGDFNIFNLKFVSWEIPFGTNVYYYSSRDSSVIPGTGTFESGEYAYLAVAQQFTEDLSLNRRDWFVAGVYYNLGDESQPGKLVIPDDTYIWNININCDFNNPPPQPPGGF